MVKVKLVKGGITLLLLNTEVNSLTFTTLDTSVSVDLVFPEVPWQDLTVGGTPISVKVKDNVVVALLTTSHLRINNSYLGEMYA